MELFAIHCTTCKARLVVKDESVIGDILGCPKCGSMVQIVPPPDWRRSNAAAPSEQANLAPPTSQTKSQPAPKPTGTTKTPVAASSPAKPVNQPSKSRVAPPKTEQPQATQSSSTNRKAAAVIPPALPPRQPAAPTLAESNAAATVPATNLDAVPAAAAQAVAPSRLASLVWRARQDWMLLAGGLASGVALGGIVWFAVWLSSPGATSVAVQTSTALASPSNSPAPNDTPTPADVPAAEVSTGAPAPVTTNTEPAAEPPVVAAAIETSPPAAVTPARSDAAAPATDVAVDATQAATPTEPATEPVVSDVPAAASTTPSLKLDPVAPSTSASEPAAADAPAAGEDVTGATPAAAEPSADGADASNPGVSNADVGAEAGGSHELTIREPAAAVKLNIAEIEKRLTVPLERLEFSRVPLAQFAAFIGDVSGVPVVLDDAALTQVGKNRKSPIDVKLSRTTAAAALRAASQQAGLSYAIEDGRILITAAKR